MKPRRGVAALWPDTKEMREAMNACKRELGDRLPRWADYVLEDFMASYYAAVSRGKGRPVAYVGAWKTHQLWKPHCDCKSRMRASRAAGRHSERCLRWVKRCRRLLLQLEVLEVIEPSARGGRRKGGKAPGRAHGFGAGRLLRRYLPAAYQDPAPDRSRPVPRAVMAKPGEVPPPAPAPIVHVLQAPRERATGPRSHGPSCVCERCFAAVQPP